jgi:hypothetical protein
MKFPLLTGFILISGFFYLAPPIIRWVVRYEDKFTQEKEWKRIREWVNENEDKPKIENSNGENYF